VQDKLRSPLFLAARGGHIAIVEMLLDSGADPNMPVERVCGRGGRRPCRGHALMPPSQDGSRLLHLCAQSADDLEFAALLMARGADVNAMDMVRMRPPPPPPAPAAHRRPPRSPRPQNKATPLHRAAGLGGSSECAKLLLFRGSAVGALTAQGLSPAFTAVQCGNSPTLKLLVDRIGTAGVNAPVNAAGDTLLHEAARSGDAGCALVLLDTGAQVNAVSGEGSTPLLLATTLGRADVLRVLLAWGAKPNSPSAAGAMPLHLAASFGHLECVAALLDAGADMTRRTKDGHTALHLACWGGHDNVTQLLLQRGAFLEAVTNAGACARERRGARLTPCRLHCAARGRAQGALRVRTHPHQRGRLHRRPHACGRGAHRARAAARHRDDERAALAPVWCAWQARCRRQRLIALSQGRACPPLSLWAERCVRATAHVL